MVDFKPDPNSQVAGGGKQLRSDKRRDGRTSIALRVDYDGSEESVFDYTENLSNRGVFLRTTKKFHIGDRIRLKLSFPGLIEPIILEGSVRWTREDNDAGVGVEFDQGTSRDTVDGIVESIQNRNPRLGSRLIRVLVVEDNPHIGRLIRTGMLGSTERYFGDQLAFNLRSASHGREALELLDHETFDALIIDVHLPILDGSTVIKHVRVNERNKDIPIIAVSTGDDSAREAALAAGADFFIEKPMRLRQVLDTMGKLLDVDLSAAPDSP